MIIIIIASTVLVSKNTYKFQTVYINVSKSSATDYDSADNHNITRLLLLTIIDSGKKCTT